MKHLMVLILTLFIVLIIGCENSSDSQKTTNASEQRSQLSKLANEQETDKEDKNRNGPKSGQIDTALYYFCKHNYEKELYDNKIVWRVNDITFIANKSNLEEKHTSDTIIDSMTIEKGNRKYDIKLDEKPISISSLGLSASNEYLAVNAFYHYGYKVIIINLNSGEYFILNEYLKSNREGFVETIHAYNWSPDSNKLAFSFGNTSKSRLAIYNLNNKTFSFIPAENDYITTAYILWHKDGKGLDFISEYPSNHYKLYRYYFNRDYIVKIMDVERDDLLKLLRV